MSWDDGKHTKVNRVQLTFDDVIRSIEVEYEGTNLQSQRRGSVGTKSDGFTLSTDEYITNVSGYYKTTFSGDVITALTFKTNKKTYGPYGNKTQNYFSADAPRDSQIAGFLGTSGDALNSIDVHFAPIPPAGSIKPKPVDPGTNPGGSKPDSSGTDSGGGSKPDGSGSNPDDGSGSKPVVPGKMGPVGGSKGEEFNDIGFEGVKKITVGADDLSITYIKIEYIKEGKVEIREHGTSRGELKEFLVDYPKDNITAVGGSYKHNYTYDTTLITSLYFTTSKGFTSPLFGKTTTKEKEFELKGDNGGKLLGFHGRGGNAIDAIGAYFDTTGSKTGGPGKIGPLGGDNGNEFNDVGFDGVKKVTVGADEYSVTYIKIEYVKEGKVEIREHGTIRGELKEFSVDYPKDSITAVGGSYKHIYTYDTTLITSLYFTTSKGFTSPLFGETKGTKFELKGENGGKLVGFHGRGGNAIDAIGAYFDTGSQGGEEGDPSKGGGSTHVSPGKMGPLGGDKGKEFNDVGFDGVKKVTIGADEYSVTYIKIEYVKDEKVEIREHGTIRGELKEFSVDYPKENITAVGGSYKHIYTYDTTLITSLYFTTSKGLTSPLFGETKGTEFELKGENGEKLLGFHGRTGNAIDAIGAYFAPLLTLAHATTKIGPIGGNKGNTFDDGVFDGVTKITVGADEYSVTYIKIEYVKDGKVEIRDHGTNRGELKEFSVNYPNEYITAVGGSYKHIYTYDTTLVTSLYFTTSKGFTSPLFGETKGTEFELKGENGGKLLGFHGRGGHAIDAIGAFFETGSGRSQKLSEKMGPVGGSKGNTFDDGVFDGVKKVTVGKDVYSVTYIKIEYANGGKLETREHGTDLGEIQEFSVDYPNDNIVAIGGTYKHIYTYDTTLVTSLYFTTSKGITSPLFGEMKGTEFELKGKNGGKLLGFHGRGGNAIDAIGAHFESGTGI